MNHSSIIDLYRIDPDAHRTLQRDALARFDQVEAASGFAEEMRQSTRRKKVTASVTRCVTPCNTCGSHNTHTANNGVFYCFDCRSIDGDRVSMPTARAATLSCPACTSKNFSVEPKNGDLFCFGCKRWSQGIGPKGRSKYTHFCVCGSGQVDITATHVSCRKCGEKAKKGLH